MCIGRVSSRCACRISVLAFQQAAFVGLEVSLAAKDIFADKSTRELVDNHCSEPWIPRKVDSPAASSLFLPLSLCRFFGRRRSAVDNFVVNSC